MEQKQCWYTGQVTGTVLYYLSCAKLRRDGKAHPDSALVPHLHPYIPIATAARVSIPFQELSKRIATAARAPIVVGDVFQDEAAGELQLRYMASLDGAPLNKAARTHEKLRTLSELLAPFSSPETDETISPLSIEVLYSLYRSYQYLLGSFFVL